MSMKLKNVDDNSRFIEEIEGVRELSQTEMRWVSGGNGKNKGSTDDKSEAASTISEVVSEVVSKLGVSGTVSVTYKEEGPDGSKIEVSVTVEVSTGGKN